MAIKITILGLVFSTFSVAQHRLEGKINFKNGNKFTCILGIRGTSKLIHSDSLGNFQWPDFPIDPVVLTCSCPENESVAFPIHLKMDSTITIDMYPISALLDEVSVVGKQKSIVRSESPFVMEIFDKKHFDKNTTSSFIEMMDRIPGVRTQMNCNVCGTGDIHINGLEGAYSLIVLDGIPIVGGLSSVYGLSGIPAFLIDRMEVSKGPASSIYGSESVAGVIQVFTKKASKSPEIHVQHFLTSHGETTNDFGASFRIGKKASVFTAGNYTFNGRKIDLNKDHFTDIPLQNRFSVYQKWQFSRKPNRTFTLSGRVLREKRWGGELDWNPSLEGTDSVYAESILTERQELNLAYQLPTKEKIQMVGHFNHHFQNSYYGQMHFKANQLVFFSQLTWEKSMPKNQFLSGITARNMFYNDNTVITADSTETDRPINTFLPGFFVQHSTSLTSKHQFITSLRLDFHPVHKTIFTPRIAYRFLCNKQHSIRVNAGNGFRVVNLFSEDHASLSGARKIEIVEDLKPEKSNSLLLSHTFKKSWKNALFLDVNTTLFYTYFNNRIVADYDSDPTKIRYENLDGSAVSRGISLDLNLELNRQFTIDFGITCMEVQLISKQQKTQQILTEKVNGNWTISYALLRFPLTIDYTGNLIGAMRLPLAGTLDPRPEFSKYYSIQNVQFTYNLKKNIAIFGGIKNLLNWTPAKRIPFLIAQAHDPFDKEIVFNSEGQVVPTANNPFGLQFDPSYVYAPNQGLRVFFGFRIQLGIKVPEKKID